MHTKVLEYLKTKQEETYRVFTSKLLPKDIELLGVRIPIIRQYAKQLIKENLSDEYLVISLDKMKYQEELFLYSLLLAHKVKTSATKIEDIKKFVPYINSWAVCDIFCADLKEIKKDTKHYYNVFLKYIKSNSEYQIRFFYVLALNYFLTDELLRDLLANIKQQTYTGFYDKMAVAWMLSIAYIKDPKEIESFLFNEKLDDFVFKKTISKINDSYRVKKEAKAHLKTLASNYKTNK